MSLDATNNKNKGAKSTNAVTGFFIERNQKKKWQVEPVKLKK